MAINIVGQPFAYFCQLSLLQGLPVVRVRKAVALPYLGRCQVADSVGRKITDAAMGPMDILQNAVGVRINNESKIIAIFFIPQCRQFINLDSSSQQLFFDLKANDYV